MNNLEKYKQAFVDAFAVDMAGVEELAYQGIPAWDSVGHMGLVSAIEDAFDISFDTDDIIDLTSFESGKEVLARHDIIL